MIRSKEPSKLLKLLLEHKIIAIIRGLPREQGLLAAEALADGGIVFLEVTLNTDGALEMIAQLRQQYEGRMKIGAGTVLDLSMAKEAAAAGAEYLISPNLDEEVLQYGLENGLEVWPGTMTPTEIVRAYQLGASAVKLFPMASLGIGYLKEIRAPLNHIPIIATGGVNRQNIRAMFEAGAAAVGMGSNLVDKKLIAEGKFGELRELARAYTETVRKMA
jgi:2-dehydro-3-deoxyphosphogluconate aldolase/(4S)-4-hydroxy-2-oxoglutarate aldolase